MGSSEFMHHMVLDSFDPLPDRRMDYYFAQLTMLLRNYWRDPKKEAPFTLDDFLLFKDGPARQRTPEEVEDNLRLIFG